MRKQLARPGFVNVPSARGEDSLNLGKRTFWTVHVIGRSEIENHVNGFGPDGQVAGIAAQSTVRVAVMRQGTRVHVHADDIRESMLAQSGDAKTAAASEIEYPRSARKAEQSQDDRQLDVLHREVAPCDVWEGVDHIRILAGATLTSPE
jgi:hypothetical protein